MWLRSQYGAEELAGIDPQKAEQALRDTEAYWRNWLRRSETGQTMDFGPWPKA